MVGRQTNQICSHSNYCPYCLLTATHIKYLVLDVYVHPPGRPWGCHAGRRVGTPPAESSGAPSFPALTAAAHCSIPPPGDSGPRDAKIYFLYLHFYWPKNYEKQNITIKYLKNLSVASRFRRSNRVVFSHTSISRYASCNLLSVDSIVQTFRNIAFILPKTATETERLMLPSVCLSLHSHTARSQTWWASNSLLSSDCCSRRRALSSSRSTCRRQDRRHVVITHSEK